MRINVSLPDGLVARVDRVRGDVSRSRFLMRAVERELEREAGRAELRAEMEELRANPAEARRRLDEASASLAPGVVRASSLVKQGVKPILKKS